MLQKAYCGIIIILLLGFSLAISEDWRLVWSDEFDYTGLPDATKWDYDVGGSGWGNNESQYYTEERQENARVENGTLIIEARRESWQGSDYTSARLVSREKGDWLYGRFEIKAKLPAGRGTWPAIWMLPTDWEYGNWPRSGEIDIMEHVGYDPGRVHFSIHTEAYNHMINTQKTTSKMFDTPETDPINNFNVYAVEWFEDHIDFYANDEKVFTFENEGTGYQVWPFDKRFHLLLNIAIGGEWGGAQGIDDTIFPTSMVVEYVRVYQTPATDSRSSLSEKNNALDIKISHNETGIHPLLTFTIPGKDNRVTVEVFSVNGIRILSMERYYPKPGTYTLPIRFSHKTVSQGVYMVRMQTRDVVVTEKFQYFQ